MDKFLFSWQLLHPGQVHILILLPAEILYLGGHDAERIRLQASPGIGVKHLLHSLGFLLDIVHRRTPGHISFDFSHYDESNVIVGQTYPPQVLHGKDSRIHDCLESRSIDKGVHPHLADITDLGDQDVKYF